MNRIICAFIGTLFALNVSAQDGSQALDVKRHPFDPQLVESKEPELCDAVLRSITSQLRSLPSPITLDANSMSNVSWIEWPTLSSLVNSSGSLSELEVDLDGKGQRQILIYRVIPHSWRGDWHYAYIVKDKRTLEELIATAGGIEKLLPDSTDTPAPLSSPALHRFFPLHDNWQQPALFSWHDRIYLLDTASFYELTSLMPIRILRLRANGDLDSTCIVEIPNQKQRTSSSLAKAGFNPFISAMSKVAGNGDGSCGTLNSESGHFASAMSEMQLAVQRPWLVRAPTYSNDNDGTKYDSYARTLEFLNDWSLGSSWNRIAFLEAQDQAKGSIGDYAEYLRTDFGLSADTAAMQARELIQRLFASWIQVPGGYLPKNNLYTVQPAPIASALVRRDHVGLQGLLNDREAINEPANQYPQRTPIVSTVSYHLHDAVLWEDGLKLLLDSGADADARNVFGKTPLMTAAHLNRPDAVRVLLMHGADVNATTDESFAECGYRVNTGHRTALMYAAENASIETIQILLVSGADSTLNDTVGNDANQYLKRNPRFLNQHIGNINDIKSLPLQRQASFSCAGKLSSTEQAICSDSILRLYDLEIAMSYGSLLSEKGTSVKIEQQRWLRDRDLACRAEKPESKVGCLQDMMSARSRSLLRRIQPAPNTKN